MKEGKAMKETGIILVILVAMYALAAGAEWVITEKGGETHGGRQAENL